MCSDVREKIFVRVCGDFVKCATRLRMQLVFRADERGRGKPAITATCRKIRIRARVGKKLKGIRRSGGSEQRRCENTRARGSVNRS